MQIAILPINFDSRYSSKYRLHGDATASCLAESELQRCLEPTEGSSCRPHRAGLCGTRRRTLLLRGGAEVNLQNGDGNTALMLAAGNGHERVVDLVIRRGAEINVQNNDGGTALMFAAPPYQHLLQAGADTAARSASGKTALQWAKEKGHAECIEAFRQHVQESVVAGRPTATAAGGEGAGGTSSGGASSAGSRVAKTLSPAAAAGRAPSGVVAVSAEVVAAAERGDEKAVLAWLEGVGRVDATYERGGVSGLTVLILAAANGHERVVELLLRRGAEINKQDSDGATALMIAAQPL